jgi:hypothetical protein
MRMNDVDTPAERVPLAGKCLYEPPTERELQWPSSRGLALLILLLTVSLAWIYGMTDWFAGVTTALTFGGFFVWLGTILGLLPEGQNKRLREYIYDVLFARRAFQRVCGGLIVLVLVAVVFAGSFTVRLAEDGAAYRNVTVRPLHWGRGDAEWLSMGEACRFPFLTAPFKSRRVEVKVSGYPAQVVDVRPFRCPTLRAPKAFHRELLVFRPSFKLVLQNVGELDMVVSVGGQSDATKLGGRAKWFGCDADVAVPEKAKAQWLAQGIAHPALVQLYWLAPEAITDAKGQPPPRLLPASVVHYKITFPNGASKEADVTVLPKDVQYPQVVEVEP